jgi:hypothetical protein
MYGPTPKIRSVERKAICHERFTRRSSQRANPFDQRATLLAPCAIPHPCQRQVRSLELLVRLQPSSSQYAVHRADQTVETALIAIDA